MNVQFYDITGQGNSDSVILPNTDFGDMTSWRNQLRAGINPFRPGTADFAAWGSSDTSDTLQSWKVANSLVVEYGLDLALEGIKQVLAAHSRITSELVMDFADVTTERQRRYGPGVASAQMQLLDQYGLPGSQKTTTGETVAFPLYRYGAGLQWTGDFFTQATTREMAAQLQAILTADVRNIQLQIKKALFTATNRTAYDSLVDGAVLLTKVLVNADSAKLPPGPFGEIFLGALHNHYMYPGSGNGDTGTSPYLGIPSYATKVFAGQNGVLAWNAGANPTQAAFDVKCLQDNVTEHCNRGEGRVYASRQEESMLVQMPGFKPLIDLAHTIPNIVTDRGVGQLDMLSINDRMIGWYNGFQVWIRSWMPPGYLLAFMTGASEFDPPLCIRTPVSQPGAAAAPGGLSMGTGDLRMINPLGPIFPMYSQGMDRRFGVSAWNRVNGAIMSVNALSYSSPTFSYP